VAGPLQDRERIITAEVNLDAVTRAMYAVATPLDVCRGSTDGKTALGLQSQISIRQAA